jgi:hypothetical protein
MIGSPRTRAAMQRGQQHRIDAYIEQKLDEIYKKTLLEARKAYRTQWKLYRREKKDWLQKFKQKSFAEQSFDADNEPHDADGLGRRWFESDGLG